MKRSRTFVIHSSNKYAAAAAMGTAVARNESSGPYFGPMSLPIAGVQPDLLAQQATALRALATTDSMIKMAFRADWA